MVYLERELELQSWKDFYLLYARELELQSWKDFYLTYAREQIGHGIECQDMLNKVHFK